MECPKCGALNADGSQFCSLCHEPFESPPSKEPSQKEQAVPKIPEEKEEVSDDKHSVPGFGDINKEPTNQKQNKKTETVDKKAENKKPDKPKTKVSFNINDWLLPAIIASPVAYLATILIPKNQFMENLPISKILLLAAVIGVTVASGGIVKLDFKKSMTNWLLGLSGGFLAFNILFFGSFILVKISPSFYTRFFLGSEILVISATLSLAIGFSLWMEKIPWADTLKLSAIMVVGTGLMAWLINKVTAYPLPFIAFIAWPLGYYLFTWQKERIKKASA